MSLVDRLRALVERAPAARLPSVSALARSLGSSAYAVRVALRALRDEGVVDFRRGSGVYAVGANDEGAHEAVRSRAHEKVAAFIRDRIAIAAYAAGSRLPKVGFFAGELRVSNHTVLAALGQLAQEMLIRREGKGWVVGSRTPSSSSLYRGEPPVVLLVEPGTGGWSGLARSERTRKFCDDFNREAERFGVQMDPVVVRERESRIPESRQCPVAGLPALMRGLGARLKGVLVVGRPSAYEAFPAVLGALLATRKPVVWLDIADERPPELPRSRYFSRVHFSERAALVEAFTFLSSMGHRRVAFANPFLTRPWSAARAELAARVHRAEFADLDFVCTMPLEALVDSMDWSAFLDFVHDCRRRRLPIAADLAYLLARYDEIPERIREYERPAREGEDGRVRTLLTFLAKGGTNECRRIDYTRSYNCFFLPLLYELVHRARVTACMIPSDWDASRLSPAIEATGIQVPRDLSVLSFDNYTVSQPLPVSTVDFGFGSLGYSAFHLILGDITVKRSRGGDVPARPHVVRRGSVREIVGGGGC